MWGLNTCVLPEQIPESPILSSQSSGLPVTQMHNYQTEEQKEIPSCDHGFCQSCYTYISCVARLSCQCELCLLQIRQEMAEMVQLGSSPWGLWGCFDRTFRPLLLQVQNDLQRLSWSRRNSVTSCRKGGPAEAVEVVPLQFLLVLVQALKVLFWLLALSEHFPSNFSKNQKAKTFSRGKKRPKHKDTLHALFSRAVCFPQL